MGHQNVNNKLVGENTFLDRNIINRLNKYAQESIKSNEQQQQHKEGTESSTISDKNEFSDNESKVIALASFPGSGNTWLR